MRLHTYLSKIDTKWKNIDILLKYNFENVEFQKDQSSHGLHYNWSFIHWIDDESFTISVIYSPFIPFIARSVINISCEPNDIKRNHLTTDCNNVGYRRFMINGISKINQLVKICHVEVINNKIETKAYMDRYKESVKNLTDAIPSEDLEEILLDIKDLNIGINIGISVPELDYYNDTLLYQINKTCHVVKFYLMETSTIIDFSEFYKLLDIATQRIKNTYDVEFKYNEPSHQLFVWSN